MCDKHWMVVSGEEFWGPRDHDWLRGSGSLEERNNLRWQNAPREHRHNATDQTGEEGEEGEEEEECDDEDQMIQKQDPGCIASNVQRLNYVVRLVPSAVAWFVKAENYATLLPEKHQESGLLFFY